MKRERIESRHRLTRLVPAALASLILSACPLLDFKSPSEVEDIVVSRVWNKNVELSWANPRGDIGFKGLRVNYAPAGDVDSPFLTKPIELPGSDSSIVLSFPVNEREYVVTIKTFDFADNESDGVVFRVRPFARAQKVSHYITIDSTAYFSYYSIYVYRENGLPEKITRYTREDPNDTNSDLILDWFEYYATKDDRVKVVETFNPPTETGNPERVYYAVYQYDKAGLLTTVNKFLDDGTSYSATSYDGYDAHGHLGQATTTYSASSTSSTMSYTYDAEYMLTGRQEAQSGGSNFTYTYTHDSNGNTTKIACSDGSYDLYEEYVTQ